MREVGVLVHTAAVALLAYVRQGVARLGRTLQLNTLSQSHRLPLGTYMPVCRYGSKVHVLHMLHVILLPLSKRASEVECK